MRLDALKLLVIYERLEFFFGIFKHEKNIAPVEQEKMVKGWLKGNLNQQVELHILPEHFGQLIFDETKKLMMEKGKGKASEGNS